MREILFRGKAQNDGEWIEGGYIWPVWWEHNDGKNEKLIALYNGFGARHVLPETVGQWTGLVDKNGKKIFEGDVVKTKYGRLCIIVWFSSPTYNGWDLEPVRSAANINSTNQPDSFDIYEKDNLEVISNIYDNPELLGKEKGERSKG